MGKQTIMVVDDEPAIGQMLTMFLGKRNHRVIFFARGPEALAYLKAAAASREGKSHPVNLLLTDMEMSEMSGLELLRQAKTLYPDLPAIVMSGSGNGPDRDEIFSLGADFITKPFDPADLLIRIHSARSKRIERKKVI